MAHRLIYFLYAAFALQISGAERAICPSDPNCICGGSLAIELNCNIDGHIVKINLLPNTYIDIKCENTTSLDYTKLPKCVNEENIFKSVSFKDCPLPSSSFKDVLTNMGVSKTMALIFQNAKNLTGYFDRKHFTGLQDLTKLLLSVKGVKQLPDNLFADINKLSWLNIRSNSINLSEELFKPLERLETLEISHNHMTNITSNLFSHLAFLRKLSLWQSNVTWFSKDLFSGVDVLEELDLSSNGLNELPASIFKPLKRLKKLTLFSNKFSSLPENLFRNNKELETVVILNNDAKLKELPKYLFGNLTRLTQIYIQRSGIEIIPKDVFADSQEITNISLAYNDIETLPVFVFNEQINLLELDLSYNKLIELQEGLFSSLLKLERLDLSHNLIEKITGCTFTSLYSLTYLNMEHNNLRMITPNLFSNTGLRIEISFAYNKLCFQESPINQTDTINFFRPFMHTYNLKLLNLSHNHLQIAFPEWWMNGHENLDLSYNKIHYLWNKEMFKLDYMDVKMTPPKKVWLSNNSLFTECNSYHFLNFLENNPKVKVMDKKYCCPFEVDISCSKYYSIYIITVTALCTLYIFLLKMCYLRRFDIIHAMKMGFLAAVTNKKLAIQNLIIKYSVLDEEFVLRYIVPDIKDTTTTDIYMYPITCCHSDDMLNDFIEEVEETNENNEERPYLIFVIFSPNYLMNYYKNMNIKKIHNSMLNAVNTAYIYANIDPENSIYTFLFERRREMPYQVAYTLAYSGIRDLIHRLRKSEDPYKTVKTIGNKIKLFNRKTNVAVPNLTKWSPGIQIDLPKNNKV